MPINPRITIERTIGEWEQINKRLKEMNRLNVKLYILGKATNLADNFRKDPASLFYKDAEKRAEQIHVSSETYETLRILSRQIKRPVSSIIDDLFIAPLLSANP